MTTIEELAPDHFELVGGWLSDPATNRWLASEWRGRSVTSVVMGVAVRSKRNRFFVIRHDGQPCGLVALAAVDIGDRVAMIWYLLGDKSVSGQGIITQAVKQVTQVAFGEMHLCSLYAWIMADNLASRRVLEKAGFREAGRIRQATCSGGEQVDRVYFDMAAESA